MADALFRLDGDRFIPHELTRGPWAPDAMHGGAVSALLARAAESVPTLVPMQAARLSIELMRPVRLVPLRVETRVLREGKKVQWVEAHVLDGDTEVAHAILLRIRVADIPWPSRTAGGDVQLPFDGPQSAAAIAAPWSVDYPAAYHSTATEHRTVRGQWGAIGPTTDLIRLRRPVVAGEEPSPLQRVAAVADFGNGISSALPYESHKFINPDLTITLHRLPEDEWVCLDAVTYPEPHGIGVAHSVLYDERGRIGHSAQTLLLEPWR
jgi:hypothetical protein